MSDLEDQHSPHDRAVEALGLLLSTIDESEGTPDEKNAATSKVAAFLHGAISTVKEGGARALTDRLKG